MRAAIVVEARSWIGTPFIHQAAAKGAGCDCAGLIRGVGAATGAVEVPPAEWKRWAAYGRQPNPPRMRECLETFLTEIKDPGEGDICWLQWREGIPMHLAFLASMDGRQTLIHALSDIGRVVEHGFTNEWPDRVHSWWRFPGVN
jgi:NlpC/P60 family putative phage cell wall peptidase